MLGVQHLRLWKVLQTLPVLDLLQHRCSIEVGAKEELVPGCMQACGCVLASADLESLSYT